MLPERRAEQELRRNLELLNARLDRHDPMPRLRFDLRGRSAGQALPDDWCIRLNASLLHRHGASFIQETVPHELAHLVAFARHGRGIRPHGTEWRALMRLLGRVPSVCHDYAVTPSRQLRRFRYACPCREHRISSIRHGRIRKGARYQCRACGGELRPLAP